MAEKIKQLKTFSLHEKNTKFVAIMKKAILRYKHLENMLNIILGKEAESIFALPKVKRDFSFFNLLTNSIIMKAVISGNSGGEKTQGSIQKCKAFLSENHNELYQQMLSEGQQLNDKNISQIVTRLGKDWKNSFKNLSKYYANPGKFTGKPETPKTKKLSKVFNYSVPLEVSKFSLKKKDRLGINIWKKMEYVFFRDNDYIKNKRINNVTVALSHGHIYYQISYESKAESEENKRQSHEKHEFSERKEKVAGLDIGVHHLFSLFVNDNDTASVVYRNAKMIHYNCSFNKHMAKLNTELSRHVAEYRDITKKDGSVSQVPEKYTSYGQHIRKQMSNMFNARNLFFDGEMNKLSSALLGYLKNNAVSDLVISKNLSFVKTSGSIKQHKKTKQKFYQIPFGRLLNLLEEKALKYGIGVVNIDESYTSKTSCLTADVNKVKQMALKKEPITPAELNGVRGVKRGKITRGLFRDRVLNTVINADINAAVNHIKVAFPGAICAKTLLINRLKLNNPFKIKSANEFSFFVKGNSESREKEVDVGSQPALYVHDQV
ncbi:transposase [Serratia sp. Se-RSBMAAmG]|uniref:transposase n=1 Tax=Serratia sp. Se-RSBMAAmG TaxID=3043305 RepID=UPI0024AEE945|nr:transposase [Serratia sp. Se-RSBMAAmG]MDI6977121.1 transposase [Serratia sp. Se-RSBMAAmG]